METGDKIKKIEEIFSGTELLVQYFCLGGFKRFSEVVVKARDLSYTVSDPAQAISD